MHSLRNGSQDLLGDKTSRARNLEEGKQGLWFLARRDELGIVAALEKYQASMRESCTYSLGDKHASPFAKLRDYWDFAPRIEHLESALSGIS